MRARLVPMLLSMFFVAQSASAAQPAGCGVFVLKREGAQIVLERVPVSSGERRVLPADSASGVIGVVFPPGPGGSGSIETPRAGRVIVLQCMEDRLRCEVRTDGRPSSGYPERSAADLARHDTRVSVVCGDGTRAVFLIEGYAKASADAGPVQNMFAGMPIPLCNADCIVTQDTYPHATQAHLEGEAAVEVAGHAFVRVTGPGGRVGWFILDTGAAQTVVAKAFLADTSRITNAEMIEYSSAGRRVLDYAPSGATGPVLGILGQVRLEELRLGTLRFRDVVADVLPEIPDFFDRPVAGIIGLDLLRRAESVSIAYPRSARGPGRLRLGTRPTPEVDDARVTFSMVSMHVVIPARVNETEVFMILDTGAPGALLDSTAAVTAGIPCTLDRPARGIDGRGAASSVGMMASLQIGERRLREVPCRVSALQVLRSLREGQAIGLFGNALMARFERVVIDFSRRELVLSGFRENP